MPYPICKYIPFLQKFETDIKSARKDFQDSETDVRKEVASLNSNLVTNTGLRYIYLL